MNWNQLASIDQISQLLDQTKDRRILLFKHSTRCPVSFAALKRIEKSWPTEKETHIQPYLIDVLKERPLSKEIALRYGVEHASPQLLLIGVEGCIYHASHENINYKDLLSA